MNYSSARWKTCSSTGAIKLNDPEALLKKTFQKVRGINPRADAYAFLEMFNFPMKDSKGPTTQVTLFLRANGVSFTDHLYAYEEHGGTSVSARELGVDERAVVKTLVMVNELKKPLVVLMHGDRKVSTKELARQIGCKRVEPCKPEVANKHSGYLVGGTSPFGTKTKMPVYVQRSILNLERIHINGGRRGYLVWMDPEELRRILAFVEVHVAAV